MAKVWRWAASHFCKRRRRITKRLQRVAKGAKERPGWLGYCWKLRAKGAGRRLKLGYCLTLLSEPSRISEGARHMAKGWRWATGRLQKAQEDRDAAYIITKRLQRAEGGPWEAAVPERHFFSDTLPLLSLGSADIYIIIYIPHISTWYAHKDPQKTSSLFSIALNKWFRRFTVLKNCDFPVCYVKCPVVSLM